MVIPIAHRVIAKSTTNGIYKIESVRLNTHEPTERQEKVPQKQEAPPHDMNPNIPKEEALGTKRRTLRGHLA